MNLQRLNRRQLSGELVQEEIKMDINIPGNKGRWRHNIPKSLGNINSSHETDFIALSAHIKTLGRI